MFKHLFLKFVAIVFLLMNIILVSQVNATSYQQGTVVNVSYLTMHSSPNLKAKAITWLKKGTVVSVLNKGSYFWYVSSSNKKGYVSSKYIKINSSVVIHSNSADSTSNNKFITYVIQKGDTLSSISKKFNMSLNSLMSLNNLKSSVIYAGKTLKVVSNSVPSLPLAGKIIVLDAGHGGHDPGASSNGLVEKNVTLDVVNHLEKKLESEGAKVYLTRSADSYPSFEARDGLSAKVKANIFISVHFNSCGNSQVNGVQTYYNKIPYANAHNPYPTESIHLANSIENSLPTVIKTKNGGIYDRGFIVLRNNTVPSVLVEVAYLTGNYDSSLIKQPTFLENASEGINQGVLNYFK